MPPSAPTTPGSRKRIALAAVVCAVCSVPVAALVKLTAPGWMIVILLLSSPLLLIAWVLGLVGALRIRARPQRYGARASATIIAWSLLLVLSMALMDDADDVRYYPSLVQNAVGADLGGIDALVGKIVLAVWGVLGVVVFLLTLGKDPNASGQEAEDRPPPGADAPNPAKVDAAIREREEEGGLGNAFRISVESAEVPPPAPI